MFRSVNGPLRIFQAHAASDDAYVLGEGPVWDGPRQRLLWVDIANHRVHTGRLRDGRVTDVDAIQFDETVGAVVCSESGELLVAGARRLYRIDQTGARHPGVQIVPDGPISRLNDGACDPQGRFLVGSMSMDGRQRTESLVRVDGDEVTVIDDDITLSNGLTWSLDGSLMYSVDTTPRVVWVRSYGPNGELGDRREFLHISEGKPDGMCTDANGNLWIAMWGLGQVDCFTPAGEHVATVNLPAPNTTSVCFVGDRLDLLLITSASEQLSASDLARYPDSGRHFICDVGVSGAPVPAWSGR
jgi:sugar lactone lactonase YvrE